MKEFRVSPSNGVRTMVFTIEPKIEAPPIIVRSKERVKTRVQTHGGQQNENPHLDSSPDIKNEYQHGNSFSPKKRSSMFLAHQQLSQIAFEIPNNTNKVSQETDKGINRLFETSKRKSILGKLSEIDKSKSIQDLDASNNVKKSNRDNDGSLALESLTNIDSKMKKTFFKSTTSSIYKLLISLREFIDILFASKFYLITKKN
jgi:hypothetical protein